MVTSKAPEGAGPLWTRVEDGPILTKDIVAALEDGEKDYFAHYNPDISDPKNAATHIAIEAGVVKAMLDHIAQYGTDPEAIIQEKMNLLETEINDISLVIANALDNHRLDEFKDGLAFFNEQRFDDEHGELSSMPCNFKEAISLFEQLTTAYLESQTKIEQLTKANEKLIKIGIRALKIAGLERIPE